MMCIPGWDILAARLNGCPPLCCPVVGWGYQLIFATVNHLADLPELARTLPVRASQETPGEARAVGNYSGYCFSIFWQISFSFRIASISFMVSCTARRQLYRSITNWRPASQDVECVLCLMPDCLQFLLKTLRPQAKP